MASKMIFVSLLFVIVLGGAAMFLTRENTQMLATGGSSDASPTEVVKSTVDSINQYGDSTFDPCVESSSTPAEFIECLGN